jgi:hypothetical protein
MAKQRKTPIRYVSLDGALCLMDPAFSSMSPVERGVYVSVVLHILAHGGSVPFDPIALTAVCNCTDGEQFLSLWQRVRENFVIKNHRLRNAWATRAITHARKARSATKSVGPVGPVRQAFSLLPSGSREDRILIMAGRIRRHIAVRTLADRAHFENVARWVVECIDSGQATEALAGKVEQAARRAAACDKPAARFIAAIRDELGYQPPGRKSQLGI